MSHSNRNEDNGSLPPTRAPSSLANARVQVEQWAEEILSIMTICKTELQAHLERVERGEEVDNEETYTDETVARTLKKFEEARLALEDLMEFVRGLEE